MSGSDQETPVPQSLGQGGNPVPGRRVGYTVEVDQTGSSEWSGMLDAFADANLYQTWSYGAVRWGERNLSHLVLRRHDELIGIAQLRIIRFRPLRAGIAYLRWGPLCHRRDQEPEPDALRRMIAALHEEYVLKRRLFLRMLPNAFVGSAYADQIRVAFSEFALTGVVAAEPSRTMLLDLRPPLEQLRKQLDQKWRNQLNQAERNGLQITEDNTPESYQAFAGMYRQMLERKKFESTVDIDEFGRIQEFLAARHRMNILLCCKDNTPVAGAVYSAMGNLGIYLLGATTEAGLKARGAYLLQWAMLRKLKECGCLFYDLGGINPEGNPGVFHFKQGLSGKDISRIAPLDSCENFLSHLIMKVAMGACRGLAVRPRFSSPSSRPTEKGPG